MIWYGTIAQCSGDVLEAEPPRRPGLAARAVLAALRVYKILVSPLFAGSCRFLPSCSDYMAEAVRLRGASVGIVLGLLRLGRCHPFCEGGVDPVPARGWRREIERNGACGDAGRGPGACEAGGDAG